MNYLSPKEKIMRNVKKYKEIREMNEYQRGFLKPEEKINAVTDEAYKRHEEILDMVERTNHRIDDRW